jgi:hypothetical protein
VTSACGAGTAIVTAALRQFEPYWPADATDVSGVELLSGIREAIDGVRARLADQAT